MADTKLSALTELAVEPADTDEIYVNDGGSSKRITYGTLKTALLARANHTGTQLASTISDFASAVAADATVTANTAKLSADDPALISALAEVTAEGTDYAVILDTSVSPNALKKILISDLLDNATHTGDVTGSGALTAQPAIITGKGAVTVAGSDLLLVADVSASPQVLGQVTASSVASLATPEGTAILSTGEVGASKFLREDGDGTCSWQTVVAGTGDFMADGSVPMTGNLTFAAASPELTVDGRNVSADGAKLDGIEAGATADQTANEILTAVKTVDGTGSGLDADLLDGNEATAFATAAQANATHTGDATGDTALTLQPAAITGKGAVTVDGADLLLVTDVSASPQVLGQVTAQSIANLAPAVQGSAILSSDTSPLVTDGYVLTADGAGGAAWEAAAASGGDFLANGTVDMTGEFKTDVGTFGSDVADGASAVAFRFGNTVAYSTSGAKLLVLDNAGTDVFGFSYQGGISHLNSGATTAAHAQSLNLNWAASTTQTSSGQYSVVAGGNNTASDAYAIAMGQGCTASGARGVALGWSCTASGGSGNGGIAIGRDCVSTGGWGVAIGQSNSAGATGAAAFGLLSYVTNQCTLAVGGGSLAGRFQAQFSTLNASTTDATQTSMLANTGNLVIPQDVSWAFSALVVGRSDEADGNDSAAYRLEGLLARDESNNTALVGSITKTVIAESAGATAWDVTAEADDTNEALAIKVTGEAATNIRWVAKVDIAQVTYA